MAGDNVSLNLLPRAFIEPSCQWSMALIMVQDKRTNCWHVRFASNMEPLHVALMLSIILCSLVAGLLFGFAIVVMPGIAKLPDKNYLLALKHMDGIIQNNQPLFLLVWAGSILSIIITLILGMMNLSGTQTYLLIFASILYFLGFQSPTFRFNIPLNNSLQKLDIEALEDSQAALARLGFETPWNRWNRIRTVNAILTVSMLLFLLIRY